MTTATAQATEPAALSDTMVYAVSYLCLRLHEPEGEIIGGEIYRTVFPSLADALRRADRLKAEGHRCIKITPFEIDGRPPWEAQ